MRILRPLLAGVLTLWLAACEGPIEKAGLQPVPHPEVADLEPAVAEAIRDARARLEDARAEAEPSAARVAEAYGRLGMAYQVHDFQQAAGACYRNALRLQPDEPRWAYYLAHVHLADGALEEAVERLRHVLEQRPDYAPARVHLGDAYARLNRPEIARGLYREALDQDGVRAAAHFGLGRLDLQAGAYESAVRHLEAVLEDQPYTTKAHYPLARSYQALGRDQEAQAHLSRRVERGSDPTMEDPLLAELRHRASGARIHLRRGEEAVRAGRLEAARDAYRKAVAADPRNPEARYNLGVALAKTGQAEEASRHLGAATRLEPASARNRLALAWILDQLERDEEAVSHYQAALNQGEEKASIHRLLGNALMRLGRPREALPHYRRSRELAPSSPQAGFREAIALVRIGRYQQARDRLVAEAEAHPDIAPIRNALARILAAGPPEVRDPERALELGQELFRETRNVTHAHTFAMGLAASGRFTEAVRAQRSVIERAEQVGQDGLLPLLRGHLERFEAGRGPDRPWLEDAAIFRPDTLTAQPEAANDMG